MPLSSAETQKLYDTYLMSNYGRAPLNLVRGEGSYVWDAEGKRYLDLLPGLGVGGLGHCPPRVVAALREQAGKLIHMHNNYLWEQQALLAQRLSELTTGMETPRAFFCNSGTEASEAGIKLARLWGRANGGRHKILALNESFHGRTFAALTATGQPKLHNGCDPLLPGFAYVPLNDAKALEKAFDGEVAAFMCEPVQGEGGINLCTREFLQAARACCDKHKALLLYDEVQCGMGRTGDVFAYQTLGAPAPDILWLAKALGGGFPIGAVLARPSVAAELKPGTHGSTYGGNPLACAAALAVLDTLDQDNLLPHVRAMGEHLGRGLHALRERFAKQVKDIRRLGLMAALDLTFPGAPVVARCRDAGLLINCTHDTVLRFLPAMNVSAAELDAGLAILGKVLEPAGQK
ncbi:MAG: acetylornithine/succinylornithine family transaminase [Planctomycetota bacterium]|nr:acetylornithine/succinylornithine family transaminase [Planctomycetota bacterium]